MYDEYLLLDFKTAVKDATNDGYTHVFKMEDGGFLKSTTLFGKSYEVSKVEHPVTPLPLEDGNFYRITTEDGKKGILFLSQKTDLE